LHGLDFPPLNFDRMVSAPGAKVARFRQRCVRENFLLGFDDADAAAAAELRRQCRWHP
jgi:hypothetical protein